MVAVVTTVMAVAMAVHGGCSTLSRDPGHEKPLTIIITIRGRAIRTLDEYTLRQNWSANICISV